MPSATARTVARSWLWPADRRRTKGAMARLTADAALMAGDLEEAIVLEKRAPAPNPTSRRTPAGAQQLVLGAGARSDGPKPWRRPAKPAAAFGMGHSLRAGRPRWRRRSWARARTRHASRATRKAGTGRTPTGANEERICAGAGLPKGLGMTRFES
jgi:hypothetical protein